MNESSVYVGLVVSLGVSLPQLRSLAFRNLAQYNQTYRYKNAKIHARMSPKECDNRYSNEHGYHGNGHWLKIMKMNFLT